MYFWHIVQAELTVVLLPCRAQSPSTRRPFWRSSRLTAALLALTRGPGQDCRRGNTAWLSWTATRQTPTPRILRRCSTEAKSPSWSIRTTMPHPCIPPKASPTIPTAGPATAGCWAPRPITWWVSGRAPATTQGPYSPPPISPAEAPRNKPCTKGGKY